MRLSFLLCAFLLVASSSGAAVPTYSSGSSGALHLKGSAPPTGADKCPAGQIGIGTFLDTTGEDLYWCSAVDTWSLLVAGTVPTDGVGTSELDDGPDSPSAGLCVAVDADTSRFTYSACGGGSGGEHHITTIGDQRTTPQIPFDVKDSLGGIGAGTSILELSLDNWIEELRQLGYYNDGSFGTQAGFLSDNGNGDRGVVVVAAGGTSGASLSDGFCLYNVEWNGTPAGTPASIDFMTSKSTCISLDSQRTDVFPFGHPFIDAGGIKGVYDSTDVYLGEQGVVVIAPIEAPVNMTIPNCFRANIPLTLDALHCTTDVPGSTLTVRIVRGVTDVLGGGSNNPLPTQLGCAEAAEVSTGDAGEPTIASGVFAIGEYGDCVIENVSGGPGWVTITPEL